MRTQRRSPVFSGILGLCLVAQLFSPLLAAAEQDNDTIRVFLVGNSILYTNNLPAILAVIGATNEKHLTVDMFARGGAQVSDLLANEKVALAIQNGAYDFVIFHDRGGDALCASTSRRPMNPDCRRMIEDHRGLAELIRSSGAVPYLLGTYQPSGASLRLVQGERYIAEEIGTAYIEISEKWNSAVKTIKDAPWLAEDGMHPGRALSALMAVEIYHAIFSAYPMPGDLSTTVPLYISRDKLESVVRLDDLQEEAANEILPAEQFKKILAVLKATKNAN